MAVVVVVVGGGKVGYSLSRHLGHGDGDGGGYGGDDSFFERVLVKFFLLDFFCVVSAKGRV